MKISHLVFSLCLSIEFCLVRDTSALPFRTRGKSSSSKEDETDEALQKKLADVVIENGVIADIPLSPSTPGSRRNEAVEGFFASGDERFPPDKAKVLHDDLKGPDRRGDWIRGPDGLDRSMSPTSHQR